MNKDDVNRIVTCDSAYIIAPAGHGKTEMITRIVEECDRKVLVLTHTNAGVDAIRKRFKKNNVSPGKYNLSTIAGFCQRWCYSYPCTANFDTSISSIDNPKEFYAAIYRGMKLIAQQNWVGTVFQLSYQAIIVDEYQDCILEQHNIFLQLNKYLPVWVLGDPMQGIFDWAGPLVDWNTIPYKEITIQTYPWRWKNSNPDLGNYLTEIRRQLLPILDGKSVSINLVNNDGFLKIINPQTFNGYHLLKEWKRFKSVVFITKFERSQLQFCQNMGGIFQEDEKQDCTELYYWAKKIDETEGIERAKIVISFASLCASHVKSELSSYINRLESGSSEFSRIKKHTEIGEALKAIINHSNLSDLAHCLNVIGMCEDFNFYRTELFEGMKRSIIYAQDNNISIFDSSKHIRSDSGLQKRYNNFKYLSSRTVLSKGLEFECVVIDMTQSMKARDFYVAMTRATKMIYILTDKSILRFVK